MTAFDRQALDPMRSVVVEACAGSGKTWLLVSRILRLLLADVKPSEILAITFTRKAAQEMDARLRTWLQFLAITPDDNAVRDFLLERAVDPQQVDALLARARGLFEAVLNAEPGVTINTFHGWFRQLLQAAPLQSGLPRTAALSEQTTTLLEEAWQTLAQSLSEDRASPAAQSLDYLFREYGLVNTRSVLFNFVGKRIEWWAYTRGAPDPVRHALSQIAADLAVNPAEDPLQILFSSQSIGGDLRAYARLLAQNTGTDRKLAENIAAALADDNLQSRFERLCSVVCTNDRSAERALNPRSRKASKRQQNRLGLAGQAKLLELHAGLCGLFSRIDRQLVELRALRFNEAALTCGAALLDAYHKLKAQRDVIDFADLEMAAYRLVGNSDHAEYMQYKLDARYRHVLLDEFQDTNPIQWITLKAWLDASVAAGRAPTVFLVGDPKQSIFRFRRADVRLFSAAARYLRESFAAIHLPRNVSRRSAGPVIDAVNQVFVPEAPQFPFQPHQAYHLQLEGGVFVLPLPPEAAASTDATRKRALRLRNPLQEPLADELDRRRELEAEELATSIRAIVGRWTVMDSDARPRPAQFGDVMLLARRRTHLRVYEAALKRVGIPYVTTRQGGLLDTLEAEDLVALLRFLVSPLDDLSLAQALRSPIFGCSDADLTVLADENEASWWARLQRATEERDPREALTRARALLGRWRNLANRVPIHDLLDRIYLEGEVIYRYQCAVPEALRQSVRANLLAILELSLKLNGGRYPTLPRFLDELRGLRRAPDQEAPNEGNLAHVADAVRILTLHGAKGLEAPLVWLIDAANLSAHSARFDALVDWPQDMERPRHFSVFATKKERGQARRALFEAESEYGELENLNLLYVGMTRARQYLVISGNRVGSGAGSWYTRLEQRLGVRSLALPAPSATLTSEQTAVIEASESAHAALPEKQPTGIRIEEPVGAAEIFGTRLHAVLDAMTRTVGSLPGRAELQPQLHLDEENFNAIFARASAIVGAAELTRFFDASQYCAAYNELSVVSAAGQVQRIDRLVEFSDSVWVLDYKSASKRELLANDAAFIEYRRQLQHYGQAIREVFPGKRVQTALISGDGALVKLDD